MSPKTSIFHIFHLAKKKHPHRSISCHVEFNIHTELQTRGDMRLQTCQFLQRNVLKSLNGYVMFRTVTRTA